MSLAHQAENPGEPLWLVVGMHVQEKGRHLTITKKNLEAYHDFMDIRLGFMPMMFLFYERK